MSSDKQEKPLGSSDGKGTLGIGEDDWRSRPTAPIQEGNAPDQVDELLAATFGRDEERLLFGDEIAHGGVGSVKKLRDRVLNRQLAVKVLHESCASEAPLVRSFLREAQVTAQLEHPNIVPIHELGTSDGNLYFSMSLVEGQSLEQWFKPSALVDYNTVVEFVEIIIKVCDALDFAHARGVLHFDLKPANIMVGEFGQVYLMDWGGSKIAGTGESNTADAPQVCDTLPELPRDSDENIIFGTPAYIAPERARGEEGDARSDVFSLGATIYEFIEGRAPFEHPDFMVSVKRAQECVDSSLDETTHEGVLPKELYRIVERAMAADPDDRHQTVAEFKTDLNRIVRGGGSFPVVEVAQGHHIIREGDSGDAAFIVASGRLRVFKEVAGREKTLRELGPGDVFGEMAIFSGSPRTAHVVALTDCKLMKITEDVIRRELDSMKPWMATFVRTLAQRFQENEERHMPKRPAGSGESPSWWHAK